MKFENLKQLISGDRDARSYYESLSKEVKDALLAHGDGINNLEELKHFEQIIKKRG